MQKARRDARKSSTKHIPITSVFEIDFLTNVVMRHTSIMTSNTTITNINALFEKVIGMACESDMVDKLKSMWTSDEVQDELAILMKR